jgi:hypothetical protein
MNRGFLYAYRRGERWLLTYWQGGDRVIRVGLVSYEAPGAGAAILKRKTVVAIGLACKAMRSERALLEAKLP